MELLRIGAAYIRVSSERQDEFSPASQLKIVRQRAERDGFQIPDEYVFYDDGISGGDTKKRDAFNNMISKAKEKTHPFDAIYVWKFSRFARNQEQSIVYKNLLKKIGVSVISVSEDIPEGPFGSLIERVIEWSDEYYLTNLSEETRRGRMERFSRGLPITNPPYGYIMKDGQYAPDESGPSDMVRRVFDMYAEGHGLADIAKTLGDMGMRTKTGKRPEKRTIDRIITNPTYAGKLWTTADGSSAIRKKQFDSESIITVDGLHTPIVTMELFEKVQAIRTAHLKKYPKYARPEAPASYLLKSLLRCSNCGSVICKTVNYSGKERTPTMQCIGYSKGRCNVSHSIVITKVEAGFIKGLEDAIKTKRFVIAPQKPKKRVAEIDYNRLIAVETRRLARAKEAFLAEVDTIEQYKANKEEIEGRIAELEKRRESKGKQTIDTDVYVEKVTDILEFIKREDATPKAKNEALRTIIEKVVYEKAKGNLAVYFKSI